MICTFKHTIYKNQYGFTVAVYITSDPENRPDGVKHPEVTCVGYELPAIKGLEYSIMGEWVQHDRFGWQYSVREFGIMDPTSKEGVIAFLSSNFIKGIGIQSAERIYSKFGQQSLSILRDEPNRLLEVPGISEKKLDGIVTSYLQNQCIYTLQNMLSGFNVSGKAIVQFYRKYGVETVDIIKTNPYKLIEIDGIDFHDTDEYARSKGICSDDERRISAALVHVLNVAQFGEQKEDAVTYLENAGHTCLPLRPLIGYCAMYLGLYHRRHGVKNAHYCKIMACIEKMVADKILMRCVDSDGAIYIYLYMTGFAEHRIMTALQRIRDKSSYNFGGQVQELHKLIEHEEDQKHVRLSDEQRRAVIKALLSPVLVITGGPGTGKSTIVYFIISVFRKLYGRKDISLCAPTGIAAKRLRTTTKAGASTIHKLLNIDFDNKPEDFFSFRRIHSDLIVVDETSMLDVFLAAKLFSAVRDGAKLIIIGDPAQLPSIGPGMVLRDLIESEALPVIRLTRFYRQDSGGVIASNSALIDAGITDLDFSDKNAFVHIPVDDFKQAHETIRNIYLRENAAVGLDNVIILTPMKRKTPTGAINFNQYLHEYVNPADDSKDEYLLTSYRDKQHGRVFRVGDRVMQIKNIKAVANGDTGIIQDITFDKVKKVIVTVDFGDRTVEYEKKDLHQLELSYCQSIHKLQGSEYTIVILHLMNAHRRMLKRKLVYTGVSRAKKKLIFVGQIEALETAILNDDTDRHTLLRYWMSGSVKAA